MTPIEKEIEKIVDNVGLNDKQSELLLYDLQELCKLAHQQGREEAQKEYLVPLSYVLTYLNKYDNVAEKALLVHIKVAEERLALLTPPQEKGRTKNKD